MFDRLIASRNPSAARAPVPSSTMAVLVHAGVCAAAVLETLRHHRVSRAAGPPIVISWPLPPEDASPFPRSAPSPGPPAPPIDAPPQAPIGLPPIDARPPFDAESLRRGAGDVRGDRGVTGVPDGPWSPAAVDDPPVLLAGPALAYPEVLRRTGTVGTVVVQDRDRRRRSGGACLPGAPQLARRLRRCRPRVRAERRVPTGARARPGGAGVGAPADRLHTHADSPTREPARRLVAP